MSGLRERKKAQTREALVRSALEQFATAGFEHVTVDDIVSACDVSPRTFFRYFAAKEDVLFADVEERRRNLVEMLEDQPDDVPPLRALRAVILRVADEYQDQREMLVLRNQIITSTPSLRGRAAERTHTWEETIIEELRRTGRAGRMSDLDLRLMVSFAVTAFRAAVEQWMESAEPPPLTKLVRTAFDRLHRGFDL